ncbi:MAG: hypothetical protein NTX05_01890, partial [Fusobacteria bacterium]|nr:hypothetical protein [Fusobacteriota bacterium]
KMTKDWRQAYDENIHYLQEIGVANYYQKMDKEALEIFKKLKRLEPTDEDIVAFLGFLYYENQLYYDAIRELNHSLDLNPRQPFVYFILGNTYSRVGNIKQAVENYEFSIFLDLDIYNAHMDFARKYERMGRFERAIKEYEYAHEIDPRDEYVLRKIAELSKEIEK